MLGTPAWHLWGHPFSAGLLRCVCVCAVSVVILGLGPLWGPRWSLTCTSLRAFDLEGETDPGCSVSECYCLAYSYFGARPGTQKGYSLYGFLGSPAADQARAFLGKGPELNGTGSIHRCVICPEPRRDSHRQQAWLHVGCACGPGLAPRGTG